MKCPACASLQNKVIDSRLSKDGAMIRRRRECLDCQHRFTTYERIEDSMPYVTKKDHRRETFDSNKIVAGLKKACEKRPISMEQIEKVVERVQQRIQETGEKEIPSALIGEEIMKELQRIDQVAYVRFASVYRSFKDINEFMDELQKLLQKSDTAPLRA